MLWYTDTCQSKVFAEQYQGGHIAGSGLESNLVKFFFGGYVVYQDIYWFETIYGKCFT